MLIIVIGLFSYLLIHNSESNKVKIAIATLMSHPALDSVEANTIHEVAKRGLIEGKNVEYIKRNANGQIQLCAGIANELASKKPDVIIAITTPMAQALAKVSNSPVVFAAVTDPVGAGIVKSLDVGEPTITGTSDAWPYKDQLKLIKEITPSVKKIGVLYNPGEAASQYGIKEIKKYATIFNFELVEGPVNSSAELYIVAQNIAKKCDALFLSSDNTVISGVSAALKVALQNKKPLYVGDSGTVEKGGLASVSVGYSQLGIDTGDLVYRVLHGEKDIPTVVAKGDLIYINKKTADLLGISIPDSIKAKATKIYNEME
jgi:putative ABC transport system substrate-binding protein